MEGFGAVFGASWRAFGRSLGPCCGHVGVLGDGFGGFGSRWETFLRPWRYFEVLREGFRGFRSYLTGFKRFSRGFYSVFTGLHLCYKFTEVFTVCSPRWRAKRAPLASEASPVGERSELRWRAKRALCGWLSLAPSLLHLQLLAWDALKIRTAWLTCPYPLFLSPLKWFRYYVYVFTLMQSHCTLCIAL